MPLPASAGTQTRPYNTPEQKRFQHDRDRAKKNYTPTTNYNQQQRAAAFSQPMLYKTNTNTGVRAQLPQTLREMPAPVRARVPVQLPGIGVINPQQGEPTSLNYGNSQLQAFLQAIAQQESGGNYGALGVQTKYGQALGKYQILDSNLDGAGGWDVEALGRDISLQQFLDSPKLQESIARHKLTEYFKQYGPEGASKAWYGGPGNANTNSDSPQYGGPSLNGYAASVLANMQRYM